MMKIMVITMAFRMRTRRRRLIFIMLGIVGILCLSAAIGISIINQAKSRGNTTTNFSNFGIAAEADGWLYTIDPSGSEPALYKMRMDESKTVKLYSGRCSSINASCGWVYFITGDTGIGGDLMKVYSTGGEALTLKREVSKALAVGYWIYCQNGTASGISKIRIDGTEDTLLADGNYTLLDVRDEWIYYLQYESGYTTQSLYKMRYDGSNKQLIMGGLYNPIIDGEWIYQCKHEEGRYIEFTPVEKIKIDGSERVTLTEQGGSKLMLDGQWLYYTTEDSIWRMKKDGSENAKIRGEPYLFMNITQDWLIYRSAKEYTGLLGGSYQLLKMRKDGSEASFLWDAPNSVEVFESTLMTQTATAGNSNNDNLVTRQGDWVFFSGIHKRIYRMRTDGTQMKIILNDNCSNLSAVGNCLYYNDVESDFYFRSTDLSIASFDVIVTDYVPSLYNNGTSIYYCNYYEDGYVYKISLKGQNKTQIGKDQKIKYLNVVGDWLYYCTTDGETPNAIVKIKTDGTQRAVVFKGNCCNLVVEGDWMYYCDEAQGKTLTKVKTDGSQKTSLGVQADHFNVGSDWIFYTDNKIKMLYRIKKDGSDSTKLSDFQTKQILIVGDWLYCYAFEDEILMRMRFDGSESKIIIK